MYSRNKRKACHNVEDDIGDDAYYNIINDPDDTASVERDIPAVPRISSSLGTKLRLSGARSNYLKDMEVIKDQSNMKDLTIETNKC